MNSGGERERAAYSRVRRLWAARVAMVCGCVCLCVVERGVCWWDVLRQWWVLGSDGRVLVVGLFSIPECWCSRMSRTAKVVNVRSYRVVRDIECG